MDVDGIKRLAEELLQLHGLDDWSFRLDHARQRCGSCNYRDREISLSRHFATLNNELEIRNTLLHEIAHALVGPNNAHNAKWRAMARQIGARPEATNDQAHMPGPKWLLVCNDCDQVVAHRHRRQLNLDRVRCALCAPHRGELRWEAGAA
ncbi:MAG: SprT-like domain-containing protein [Pseudomonadota bacterium]